MPAIGLAAVQRQIGNRATARLLQTSPTGGVVQRTIREAQAQAIQQRLAAGDVVGATLLARIRQWNRIVDVLMPAASTYEDLDELLGRARTAFSGIWASLRALQAAPAAHLGGGGAVAARATLESMLRTFVVHVRQESRAADDAWTRQRRARLRAIQDTADMPNVLTDLIDQYERGDAGPAADGWG